VIITKYGKETAVLVNPEKYEIKKKGTYKSTSAEDIINDEFIGMYENRKDWEGKSTTEIVKDLRKRAWYEK